MQTTDIKLIHPNGHLAFCPVDKFHQSAPAAETAARDVDEFHMENRAVIVEPTRGLFGRFRRKPRINQFLTRPLPANPIIAFTGDATKLMARRARNTYDVFRRIWEDLADLGNANTSRTVTLDKAALLAYRERFPAWKDADPFSLS